VRTPSLLRRLACGAVDLVLPPRCLACGTEIDDALGLCPGCWAELQFLSAPYCRCCGFPVPYTSIEAPLCARCAQQPPDFDHARSALRYDAGSARLILRFKRGGRLEGVPLFARWMLHAGEELIADIDLIVPVPLHRWRLLRRGFNQSALIAKRLAILANRPWGRESCCATELLNPSKGSGRSLAWRMLRRRHSGCAVQARSRGHGSCLSMTC
jgi:predicted amidophosphoribosyltransferase